MNDENKRKVLETLDIRAAYEAMGLDTRGEPNNDGWITCKSLIREDRTPSAGINVNPNHKHFGYFHDHGVKDGETHFSFWDACAKRGLAPTAEEAFQRFAVQTGFATAPPRMTGINEKPTGINEKIKRQEIAEKEQVPGFTEHRPPCGMNGFLLTGGMKADVGTHGMMAVLPVYDANVNDDNLLGGAVFNWFQKTLDNGKKNVMIQGSKAGLMGRHGLKMIQEGKAEVVFLTEGIPDMVALQSVVPPDKIDSVAVVTHSQGANERPKDWQVQMFAGKNVVVIPDADEAGMSGGERWAAAIKKGGAVSVKFLPLYDAIAPSHGKDLRDWLLEGHVFDELMELVEKVGEFVGKGNANGSLMDYPPEFIEKMLSDLKVCIFGQDSEQQIHGYSFHMMSRFIIKDRNRYTYPDLYGHCGDPVGQYVLKTKSEENDVPGKYTFGQVFEVFYRKAAERRIRNLDLHGQGIWRDPKSKDAVIVLGNGQAAVWNGKTLERIVQPSYGDLQLDMQIDHAEFVDFDILKEALENYDDNKAKVAFAELKELLKQWNWKVKCKPDKDIVVTLLAALATASFIQSTLIFRPQIYITGDSFTGKSHVHDPLLKNLFGNLADPVQKPTESSLRQLVKMNSRMLLIDELETDKKNPHVRERVFKMLRSATGDGGDIIRGTTGQKDVIRFRLKHITWLASIETKLTDPADASRFFLFKTQAPVEKDGKKSFFHLPPEKIRQIGFDLMVFAIKNMNVLLETIATLSRMDIENTTHRNLDGAAVPAAVAEMLSEWTREETKMFMFCSIQDHTAEKTLQVTSEHTELLRSIQTAIILVDNTMKTVTQAIRDSDYNLYTTSTLTINKTLEMYGLKITTHDDKKVIVFEIGTISRNLLNKTEWCNKGLEGLLERLEDAQKIRSRFNGIRGYNYCIPLDNFIGNNDENKPEF